MNLKETLCAITGVMIGLTMFAVSYPHVKPRVESFAEGIQFYYVQPFVDKFINKDKVQIDELEFEKCTYFECAHKETI